MSEEGRMPPRYGFDVNGYARQMYDGYWTPWHIATAEIAALRAALDQERADNERLRAFANMAAKIAVEMSDDDFGLSVELEHAGLIDDDGNPTALLSGRGEGGNDG